LLGTRTRCINSNEVLAPCTFGPDLTIPQLCLNRRFIHTAQFCGDSEWGASVVYALGTVDGYRVWFAITECSNDASDRLFYAALALPKASPIVLAIEMGRIPFVAALRLSLALAFITFVFLAPINYGWFVFLGWLP
jgi:hypothetical protein